MSGEIDVLRALAHPVRWGIVRRLAAEPGICAGDFTEFFDVSQPTISAHLKVLREAGLVTTRRRGTTICYTLAGEKLSRLTDVLTGMAATATVTVPAAGPEVVPCGPGRAGGLAGLAG
jgi:ArsR family transcriptional regulator